MKLAKSIIGLVQCNVIISLYKLKLKYYDYKIWKAKRKFYKCLKERGIDIKSSNKILKNLMLNINKKATK